MHFAGISSDECSREELDHMAVEGKGMLRRFPVWQTLLLDLAISALRGAVAAGIVWRKRRHLDIRWRRHAS